MQNAITNCTPQSFASNAYFACGVHEHDRISYNDVLISYRPNSSNFEAQLKSWTSGWRKSFRTFLFSLEPGGSACDEQLMGACFELFWADTKHIMVYTLVADCFPVSGTPSTPRPEYPETTYVVNVLIEEIPLLINIFVGGKSAASFMGSRGCFFRTRGSCTSCTKVFRGQFFTCSVVFDQAYGSSGTEGCACHEVSFAGRCRVLVATEFQAVL